MQLPNRTDKPNSLPHPELNPLLNPVLGAHMGRWAEVYFTSPPERREQAVADLLRELEGDSSMRAPSVESDNESEKHSEEKSENIGIAEPSTPASELVSAVPASPAIVSSAPQSSATQSPAEESNALICIHCGHDNATGQKFCGMCGQSLQTAPQSSAPDEPAFAEPTFVEPAAAFASEPEPAYEYQLASEREPAFEPKSASEPEHRSEREPRSEPETLQYESRQESTSAYAGADRDGSEDRRTVHDYSDPNTVWRPREDSIPTFGMESQSVPYRYRLYVGALIAILLVGLVYMGWRSTRSSSGSQQSASSAVVPAAVPPDQPLPTEAAPPAPSAVGTGDAVPSKGAVASDASKSGADKKPEVTARPDETSAEQPDSRPPASRQAASGQSVSRQPVARQPVSTQAVSPQAAPARPGTARSASRVVTMASGSSPIAGEQGGADDLAMAEKYLNAPGAARDTREASLYLWRAVGKGSLAATITLSDLYLRGDGVTKSCDQAHLLLDVAARKGSAAAADRLRNLQAFGCQ